MLASLKSLSRSLDHIRTRYPEFPDLICSPKRHYVAPNQNHPLPARPSVWAPWNMWLSDAEAGPSVCERESRPCWLGRRDKWLSSPWDRSKSMSAGWKRRTADEKSTEKYALAHQLNDTFLFLVVNGDQSLTGLAIGHASRNAIVTLILASNSIGEPPGLDLTTNCPFDWITCLTISQRP
jgi:hypothetical protein